MTSITPPPEWYARVAALRLLQGLPAGLPAGLPLEPEPDSNVMSIEAGRTRRATRELRRRGEL
jgi:hypothetical protein